MNHRRALVVSTLGLGLTLGGAALSLAPAQGDHGVPLRLQKLLAADETAHLDDDNQLFYVDPLPDVGTQAARPSATGAAAAAYDLSQTFLLHSRPGSQHTVYLDFDGATVSGTLWNSKNGLPAAAYDGYSTDSSPAFSTAEQTSIQSIWQRVAEDYAPFDVDVTTQLPAAGALTRTAAGDPTYGTVALISGSTAAATALCSNSCGGVAYVGTFDDVGGEKAQPAWIFAQLLSNSTKSIAEAVSHEVGHNFGLNHDGQGSSSYYAPSGTWAPIMGAGYNAPVTQWSQGEYAGATNTQDDLAVIAAGGAPLITDDAGDTVAAASSDLSGTKLITTRADRDVFALGACTGTLAATATPAGTPSPDLDLSLDLLDASGAVVGSADPLVQRVSTDVASGLGAALSTDVAGTAFYARVDGVGAGDPTGTGYSDYASLGQYTITASCTPTSSPPVTPAPVTPVVPTAPVVTTIPVQPVVAVPGAPTVTHAASGRRGGRKSASVRWAAPVDGGAVSGYRVLALRGGTSRAVATLGPDASSYVLKSRSGGAYRFAIVALGPAGASEISAPSAVVQVR